MLIIRAPPMDPAPLLAIALNHGTPEPVARRAGRESAIAQYAVITGLSIH
jgi:hypothetical protein